MHRLERRPRSCIAISAHASRPEKVNWGKDVTWLTKEEKELQGNSTTFRVATAKLTWAIVQVWNLDFSLVGNDWCTREGSLLAVRYLQSLHAYTTAITRLQAKYLDFELHSASAELTNLHSGAPGAAACILWRNSCNVDGIGTWNLWKFKISTQCKTVKIKLFNKTRTVTNSSLVSDWCMCKASRSALRNSSYITSGRWEKPLLYWTAHAFSVPKYQELSRKQAKVNYLDAGSKHRKEAQQRLSKKCSVCSIINTT